jgi:hypothetical protein
LECFDKDDRSLVNRHAAILSVFTTQEFHGFLVSLASKYHVSFSRDENIRQTPPVLVVTIDDQGNFWIFREVAQPFELGGRNLLGFFINRREKLFAVRNEADRDNQWLAGGIRCGQVSERRPIVYS